MPIPMALMTVLSPQMFFSGNDMLLSGMVFFSQLIFIAGSTCPKKGLRIPIRTLGFIGMAIVFKLFAGGSDTGGEIGAKDYSGIAFAYATGIPFLLSGMVLLIGSLRKVDANI